MVRARSSVIRLLVIASVLLGSAARAEAPASARTGASVASATAGSAGPVSGPLPVSGPGPDSGAPPALRGAGRWAWPVPPPHPVLRGFEAPAHRYAPGHRGIDIGAAPGSPVRAVEAGIVRYAGVVAGRGTVSVLHADGLLSTYEPVAAGVAAGQPVAAGEPIGTLSVAAGGGDHCAQGSCLHLGARTGRDYRDPRPLLGAAGPSVLLTWGGVDD